MPSLRRTLIAALAAGAALLAPAGGALAAAPDAGDVTVEWDRVVPAARPYANALRRSGAVERVAAEVNARYALPREIPIVFSSQLEVGPAYLPDVVLDDQTQVSFIHVPGWFFDLEITALRKELRGVRGLTPVDAMIFANQFVIAHEIGHALVDQLDLPVTGREEDAVDGFAAYLLADNERFGPRAALAAALLFAGLANKPRAEDFADEHSLAQQRVYQFLCWVYGSDPKTFRSLVGRGGLPRARAVRCTAEWSQLNRSWERLLRPFAKG